MYIFTDNDYKTAVKIFRHFHQIKSYNLVTKRLQNGEGTKKTKKKHLKNGFVKGKNSKTTLQ